MNIVFFGTPETALPFLEFLTKAGNVVGAVTQPDKPSMRGQKLHAPPVKILAGSRNIPVLQPVSLKDPSFAETLQSWKGDLAVVVAYGRLIPPSVIRLFPKGMFNIHFSLLPHLRGAAPMQWALLNGDQTTGVTSFRISETLDTGSIAVQKETSISDEDDAVSLENKLVSLGIEVLKETIEKIGSGTLIETPQTGTATHAPLLTKEHAKIDWSKSAEEIGRQVRALVRTGAVCRLSDGRTLKVLKAAPKPSSDGDSAPGTVISIEKGLGFLVKCGQGALLITRVQPEGKKEMDAWSFWQGARLLPRQKLQ